MRHQDSDARNDAELLAATPNDPEVFSVFYHRHVDGILGYFLRRTHDRNDAADLSAETFAAALDGLHRFNPSRGTPSQWLYGIAGNQLKRFWRRRKASTKARERLNIQTPTLPTAGWDDIAAANARLDSARLESALRRVPKGLQDAVRLRVLKQLEYDDIGSQLGCSAGAARVRVMRGLRRLQQEFDDPTTSTGVA